MKTFICRFRDGIGRWNLGSFLALNIADAATIARARYGSYRDLHVGLF